MALVGVRYIQTNDPGAVGAGYEWLNTVSGDLKIRNTANTAWVLVGNIDQARLGQLPRTGGAVTGNITGATGWAPSTGNNFASYLQVGGYDVATKTYVDSSIEALMATIKNLIESGMNTYAEEQADTNTLIRKYIGIKKGSYSRAEMDSHVSGGGNGIVLPKPQYTIAGVNYDFTYNQCIWALTMDRTEVYDEVDGDRNLIQFGWVKENGTTFMEDLDGELPANGYKCWPRVINDGWESYKNVGWSYMIIGLRADGE